MVARGPATHIVTAITFRSVLPPAKVYHQQACKLSVGPATGCEPGVSFETGTAGAAVMMAGPAMRAGGCLGSALPLLQVLWWWQQAQQYVQGGRTT